MEGVNGGEIRNNRVVYSSSSSRNVDYHVKNLVISHLSTPPELTPQEIAESSRAIAEAAAIAAKAARATAVEKAAAASRAIAAAKSALLLIASFPKHKDKQVVASDLSSELPSKLQLGNGNGNGNVSEGIISNSSSSCEDKNDQCEEQCADTAMEIDSPSRMIESGGGEEGIHQVARKRGRPKSKGSKPSAAVS